MAEIVFEGRNVLRNTPADITISVIVASTQVAMAESIIVGEVPDTFTDVGDDMDILDLVP